MVKIGAELLIKREEMPKRILNQTDEKETFGNRLARLRTASGHTQRSLATALGISNRMIAHYETENGNPTVYMLKKIAKALGVSGDQLLGIEKTKEAKKKTPKNT